MNDQYCGHMDWDNRSDCDERAEYICMCCAVGVCDEHKRRECPYGGMEYIEISEVKPEKKT